MNFFDITEGISRAENDILSAILDGKDAFRRSECFWRASLEQDAASEESTVSLDVLYPRLDAISLCIERTEAAAETGFSALSGLLRDLEIDDSEDTQVVSPSSWLLDNLHNPYPSSATKALMESSPELGRRSVNEWFVRARQRIGWTRLLQDRFSGSRTAATDAAFRAFVRDDPCSPLDHELRAAFVAVRSHTEFVYASTSPEPRTPVQYTPGSSRSQSPVSSLTHSSDSEDGNDEVSQFPRKRKRTCSETSSDPAHPVSSPARKRRWTSSPQQLPLHQLPSSLPPLNDETSLSCARKRCSSEPHSDGPAVKKPRGLDWALGRQSVSDPLLLASSFDWESWSTEAFTLPSLAALEPPPPDALDFELFNFGAHPIIQPTDVPLPQVETSTEQLSKQDAWGNSVPAAHFEQDPCSVSWEDFFNFELPCQTSPMPSLTNSPSSPDTLWSLPPPELSCFDSLESSLFDFSSPSLFKIPSLYPADSVEIVDTNNSLIL